MRLTLTLLVSAALSIAQVKNPARDEAQIEQLAKNYRDAVNDKDRVALAKLFVRQSDAAAIPLENRRPWSERSQLLLHNLTVRFVNRDVAVVEGSFGHLGPVGGGESPFTWVVIRDRGQWFISRDR